MAHEIMYADSGETDYGLILRAKAKLSNNNLERIQIVHNDVRIMVRRDSNIDDLYEKFDLARQVMQLESQYRR